MEVTAQGCQGGQGDRMETRPSRSERWGQSRYPGEVRDMYLHRQGASANARVDGSGVGSDLPAGVTLRM